MTPFKRITQLLESQKVAYEVIEHLAVSTSEDGSQIRKFSLEEVAKSLLLKTNGRYFLVVIPGNEKLDSRKLKRILGTRNLRFATPDEVFKTMGCEIGTCYPFGNLLGMKTFVDTSFKESEYICVSPGKHTQSFRLRWKDFERIAQPEMVEVIMKKGS